MKETDYRKLRVYKDTAIRLKVKAAKENISMIEYIDELSKVKHIKFTDKLTN